MNNSNQNFLDKILSETNQETSNFELELLQSPILEQEFVLKIKDKTTNEVQEIKMTGLDTSGAVSVPMSIEQLKNIAKQDRTRDNEPQIKVFHPDPQESLSTTKTIGKGGTSFSEAIGSLRQQYIGKDTDNDNKLKIK